MPPRGAAGSRVAPWGGLCGELGDTVPARGHPTRVQKMGQPDKMAAFARQPVNKTRAVALQADRCGAIEGKAVGRRTWSKLYAFCLQLDCASAVEAKAGRLHRDGGLQKGFRGIQKLADRAAICCRIGARETRPVTK
jgi:hypothetical protein